MIPTVRTYGNRPYQVAVLHGGPGAPGYMAPVARELSISRGVLEPLQTRDTLDGQIEELHGQFVEYADLPVTLIGSSWGAVLALFVAARYNKVASKLILVGSAVFDAAHSAMIRPTQLGRLDPRVRDEIQRLGTLMENASDEQRHRLFEQRVDLLFDTDVYDPITRDLEVIEVQTALNAKVWGEYVSVRDEPGYLDREFAQIDVPVVVIHGLYDPRSIDGVRPFLSSCLTDVSFHVLPKCGHYPWIERYARDKFYEILRAEISV